jgi:hypothetical protein
MPRYERILPLIGIVMMGLGLILLVEGVHSLTFVVPLPGGQQATVSIAWLILFFLLVVMAAGTESVQREERQDVPQALGPRRIRLHPTALVVPVLLTLTAFLFLRLVPSPTGRAVGLGIVGLLLFAVFLAQHYSQDERETVSSRSRRAVEFLVYLNAFFLYWSIYFLKVRSLFSATSITVFSFMLATVLLQGPAPREQIRLYAAVVGLSVGEITWPLNYWAIGGPVGGGFLLVVFYALVNVGRRHLQDTLTPSVVLEYVFVVLLGVGLVTVYLLFPQLFYFALPFGSGV